MYRNKDSDRDSDLCRVHIWSRSILPFWYSLYAFTSIYTATAVADTMDGFTIIVSARLPSMREIIQVVIVPNIPKIALESIICIVKLVYTNLQLFTIYRKSIL